jgi:hypothetical protein
MAWKPNVTAAAVIAREGRFLLVMRCIDDYLASLSYPLAVLHHHPS